MTSFKRPLRFGAFAGASILALTLAMPAMANDVASSTGMKRQMAQANSGQINRSGDMNKIGETPNQQPVHSSNPGSTTSGTSVSTPPQNAGDMNKLGETRAGTPAGAGTPIPSGTARPMGDSTMPGSGQWGSTSGDRSDGQSGTRASQDMRGQTYQGSSGGSANLEVGAVRIQDLPPSLQQTVRSRMGPRQTTSELVKTTILNRLALMGSDYKLNSTRKDGSNYVLFVTNPSGQQATMLYETTSGNLSEVQM